MNHKSTAGLTGMASALAILTSMSANVSAQQPFPVQQPAAAPYQMPTQPYPMRQAPMPRPTYGYPYRSPYGSKAPMPYGSSAPMPYGSSAPMYRPPAYNSPQTGNRYGNTPWGGNRYGNTPWGGNRPGNSPWNGNRRFGGMPWGGRNNGSRGPIPFESNFTPWSTRFWDEIGEGGEMPFKNMDEWFDPNEPREGLGNMWDDLLNAPNEAGQMPGGWTAPSISVPNPVDVQREFEKASKQVPDEIRYQMDNIDVQTW